MTLAPLASIGVDLISLTTLVGGLYVRRHSRKDLLAAYVGVNVGVLAVTLLLATSNVGAGLGLGLFGVLSIIRLRSTELAQHEVAYFFAALALGLLGGIEAPLGAVAILMTSPCGSATTPPCCAATGTRWSWSTTRSPMRPP